MLPEVTLGWDGWPTIILDDGKVYLRSAELLFNKQYYPNWPEEKWPVDPITKQKLPKKEWRRV